ncbi:hypothetical protein CJF30_00000542 [Rutstroemia sp. NJR-2017a BBW]|nr:hypothetical protein CJF30_00000542 [Rutstroemia sp. NJR-2017a BBW]
MRVQPGIRPRKVPLHQQESSPKASQLSLMIDIQGAARKALALLSLNGIPSPESFDGRPTLNILYLTANCFQKLSIRVRISLDPMK